MNDRARHPIFSPILPAAACLLAACGAEAGPPPLQGATMGGPFTLTSHQGQRVSSSAFAGKYRIVYFGYTFCPDVCPVDLQLIGAALRQFERSDPARAARVQPIFITTDPARDTPAVLRQFVAQFHPRLIGLTGSEAEVAQVARTHGVYFARRDPASASAYLVDHNRIAVLYGPEGEPIAILPHDQGPAGIIAELERWVA
jgi:protein SCO1/2